jgi:hypothetical protein
MLRSRRIRDHLFSEFCRLTTPVCRPYNPGHTARRPLSARWRASEAPHFRVEQISEKKSEVPLRRLPDRLPAGRGEETARFPGSLTSESEERETWTAESLRTATSERATFLRCGHGRDTAVLRFKVHRTGFLDLRAQARRCRRSEWWTSSMERCTRIAPRKRE